MSCPLIFIFLFLCVRWLSCVFAANAYLCTGAFFFFKFFTFSQCHFRVKAVLNQLLNHYHNLLISLIVHPHLTSQVLLKWPFENTNVITFTVKTFVVRNLSCLMKRKVKVKLLSNVWLFATPWTVACQALLSMRFSRQEYWSVLPFPTQGSPTLQAGALPSEPPGIGFV